ncbi:putative glyoxalase family protein [Coleophoma cylindrospora]|uniref:Putative glyoxalase family protein n=1 Tax=Coleophoma cylindrospora TaxID=1849047 RepID=A0A3D8SEP9_9HELO|nr:putative glyoxalase family protein [Coleophoma cylindrospora]
MITGIAHVNITVPEGTLGHAEAFYGKTLGLQRVAVPVLQKDSLAWFDITPKGQQIHVAFGANELHSSRHICFRIESPEALVELQKRIWDHHIIGDAASPKEADKPGEEDSGMLVELTVFLHLLNLK